MTNSINRDSNYLLRLEIKGQGSTVIRFQRFCVDKLDNILGLTVLPETLFSRGFCYIEMYLERRFSLAGVSF